VRDPGGIPPPPCLQTGLPVSAVSTFPRPRTVSPSRQSTPGVCRASRGSGGRRRARKRPRRIRPGQPLPPSTAESHGQSLRVAAGGLQGANRSGAVGTAARGVRQQDQRKHRFPKRAGRVPERGRSRVNRGNPGRWQARRFECEPAVSRSFSNFLATWPGHAQGAHADGCFRRFGTLESSGRGSRSASTTC
jgi:hypothetical protein